MLIGLPWWSSDWRLHPWCGRGPGLIPGQGTRSYVLQLRPCAAKYIKMHNLFKLNAHRLNISKLTCCCCRLVAESSLILFDPMDCSPSVSSIHGISQARIVEQVAIPFSRRSSWPRYGTHVSCLAGGFFTTELTGKQMYHEVILFLKGSQDEQKIRIRQY